MAILRRILRQVDGWEGAISGAPELVNRCVFVRTPRGDGDYPSRILDALAGDLPEQELTDPAPHVAALILVACRFVL